MHGYPNPATHGRPRPQRHLAAGLARRRGVALLATGLLALAACGDGPAAPDYGAPLPGEENRGGEAFEDNPKDAAALAAAPRQLADKIGCNEFTLTFSEPSDQLAGSCQLQGHKLWLVAFPDQNAQQAYLQTHQENSALVVDDLWAVRAPNQAVAQQVQHKLGGRLA